MDVGQTKIAVLCDYKLLSDRVGGMDYFFWEFDKKCTQSNIQVDWFFPNGSDHGGYKNMNCINCNNAIEEHFLNNVDRNQYSHIITHFLEICTPFFYKMKSQTSAKVIAVDHNSRPIGGYGLKKRFQKRVKGLLFSRYIDCFVGVSKYTVNELKKDFGSRISRKTVTVYNGISYENIIPSEARNRNANKFLVVAYLRESKGIQDLIDAVSNLPHFIQNNIIVDIYGYGPYKAILENKIQERKCTNFNFMGSYPNLNQVYHNYDYMILPTHMECFNLSILESLAANVPVITTNVGGNEEAVKNGQNGFIFDAHNSRQLEILLRNVYLGTKTIQVNTRELVATQFSLEKMVNNHLKLLDEI
jgi:glycosyltransferase involved in cell wall biosynthesis